MRNCGTYKIQSIAKPTLCYIGSSINLLQRIGTHRCHLIKGTHQNKRLQEHSDKYGIDDLVFTILLECEKNVLIKTEQFFIDAYNPYFNKQKKVSEGRAFNNKEIIHRLVRVSKENNRIFKQMLLDLYDIGVFRTPDELADELFEIGLNTKKKNL